MFGLGTGFRFASRNYEEYKERRRERIEEKHEEGIIEEVGSSSGSQWCAIVPPVPKQRQMSMSRPMSAHNWELGTIAGTSGLQFAVGGRFLWGQHCRGAEETRIWRITLRYLILIVYDVIAVGSETFKHFSSELKKTWRTRGRHGLFKQQSTQKALLERKKLSKRKRKESLFVILSTVSVEKVGSLPGISKIIYIYKEKLIQEHYYSSKCTTTAIDKMHAMMNKYQVQISQRRMS